MASARVRIGVVVLVVAIVGLVALVWRAWPWLIEPPESPAVIDARWAEAQSLASASPESAGSDAGLVTALGHLQASALDTSGPWDRARPAEGLELDAEALRALESLVAWAEQGGGLGGDPCVFGPSDAEPRLQVVSLSRLARLAIRAGRGPDDPLLVAALRLGAHLRQRGTLIAGVVGFSVADDALEVARARGDAVKDAYIAHAPLREEVLPIFAREAVCAVRMAEQVFPGGAPTTSEAVKQGRLARWLTGRSGPGRELAMVRWYFGARLARAAEAPRDLDAVRAALAVEPDEELPGSLLIHAMAFDHGGSLERMAATISAYEEFVAAGAPP